MNIWVVNSLYLGEYAYVHTNEVRRFWGWSVIKTINRVGTVTGVHLLDLSLIFLEELLNQETRKILFASEVWKKCFNPLNFPLLCFRVALISLCKNSLLNAIVIIIVVFIFIIIVFGDFFISIVWGFFLLVLLVWTQKHSENLTCFQDSRLPSIYQLTLRWCRAWSTVEPECINKVFAPWVFRYIIMA